MNVISFLTSHKAASNLPPLYVILVPREVIQGPMPMRAQL